MRSFKRPLSILIAALMLVSIMVIAPVTASAEDGDTVQVDMNKWIKGVPDAGNDGCFQFDDLYASFKFVRIAKEQTPVWGTDSIVNEGGQDLSLEYGKDTFVLNNWDNHRMYGYWDDYGVFTEGIHIDARYDVNWNEVDWYAYTWETFTLTKHAEDTLASGGFSNIECYTSGSEGNYRYYLKSGDNYNQVDASQIYTRYDTAGTVPVGEGDADVYGFDTNRLPNIGTLGCQEAIADNNGTIRFVSVLNTNIAKDADEYGYIVAKTKQSVAHAMQNCAGLTYENAGNGKMVKYNCKGTSNKLSGDYGDYNADTPYKYVTFSINELSEVEESDWVIMTRFYIKKGGTVMYSQYGDYNCLAYAIS